jgi:hypothetical protein
MSIKTRFYVNLILLALERVCEETDNMIDDKIVELLRALLTSSSNDG